MDNNTRERSIKKTLFDYRYELGVAIITVLAAIALSYNITRPWAKGHDGFNGSLFSTAARNFLVYGFIKAKFAQIINPAYAASGAYNFYMHHPPLISLLVALSFKVFGVYEWSARLVPVLFSIASVPLVFLVGKELWNKRVGLIAASVFVVNPMFIYFGQMIDHEAFVNFFALLIVLSYVKWVRGNNRYIWVLSASSFAGGMTDWPIYYLALVLSIHYLLFVKRKSFIALTPLAILAVTLIILVLQIWSVGQQYFGDLVNAFVHRSSENPSNEIALTLGTFLRTMSYRVRLFTIPLLATALIGVTISLVSYREKQRLFTHPLLLGLFAYATIHVLLFRNGAVIHPYWVYYFLPPIAFSAGIALDLAATYMPKNLTLAPALIVIIAMAFTSKPVLAVLYNEDTSYPYLGTVIASITKPDSSVLLTSSVIPQKPQIGYYAKQNIIGPVDDLQQFQKALKDDPTAAIMITDQRDDQPALQNYLGRSYRSKRQGSFIIYDLHAKK